MSGPKRHHFVPRSYLAGFAEADTGFLNLYSKRSKHWRRQNPKQVMTRNKYYRQDWVPEGVDPNILENRLAQSTEPHGLTALRLLITTPEIMTDTGTAALLNYLEFQRIRVPRQAEMAMVLARNALTIAMMRSPTGRETLRHNRLEIKDSFRFEFMRQVSGRLTPYLSRMRWDLFTAEAGTSFITSDSPVSFCNIHFPPPTEAGLGLYGTCVVFPINTKYLLVLTHPEYARGERGASEQLPGDLEVEDGEIEIHRGRALPADQVHHYNWLTMMLSQDLIAGTSKSISKKPLVTLSAADPPSTVHARYSRHALGGSGRNICRR